MSGAQEQDDPLLGRVIANRIELVQLLGAGACGKVYRAHHRGLDKTVAIKVLHKTEGPSSPLALRFKAEARAASRLDHPNSVRILDFGEDGPDGLLYIAMEFLSGVDLQTVLRQEGVLPPDRVLEIMTQVLAALAVAHGEGVVHRDMKPGNIMLLPRTDEAGGAAELVKVCDFGLAKILDVQSDASGAPLTKQGTVLGTPAYMSPEQASGELTDGLTDVYSCGCIMYQMLTGRVPFTAETTAGILIKHIMEAPAPILAQNPAADPRLAGIAERAMAKNKAERWPSARDMLLALREVARAQPGEAPATWLPAPRRPSELPAPLSVRPGRVPAPMGEEVGFLDTIQRGPAPQVPSTASISSAPPPAGSNWALISAVVGSLALFLAGGTLAYLFLTRPAVEQAAPSRPVPEDRVAQVDPPAPARADPPPAQPPEPVREPPPAEPTRAEPRPGKGRPRTEPAAGAAVSDAGQAQPDAAAPDAAAPDAAAPDAEPPPVDAGEAVLTQRPPLTRVEPPALVEPRPRFEEPRLPVGFAVELEIGEVSLSGGLSTRRARDGLLACDKCMNLARSCVRDAVLKHGKPAKGAVRITARLDPRGALLDLKGSAELPGVERCAAEAFSSARMPKADTGEGRIKFELLFRAG